MKPPASVSGAMASDMARMPCGRMAAMKPLPLAATTLGSRIGSPAAMDERTMAPTKSLMASGRSVFLMKIALAEAAVAALPWAPRAVEGRSPAWRQRRRQRGRHRVRSDARLSLRFTFQSDTTAGTAVNSGFHQLNVKAWLMRSIQIALIARYAALCGDRIQRLSHTIEPARGL